MLLTKEHYEAHRKERMKSLKAKLAIRDKQVERLQKKIEFLESGIIILKAEIKRLEREER